MTGFLLDLSAGVIRTTGSGWFRMPTSAADVDGMLDRPS
jgi:hypothetical protein